MTGKSYSAFFKIFVVNGTQISPYVCPFLFETYVDFYSFRVSELSRTSFTFRIRKKMVQKCIEIFKYPISI